ncbi:ArsR/SmtB family transcription factor [Pseudonocardia pini]|uniref:ArsR/SmtB family transcription factor n=1 Tax=Pseudonocardia pini TaxID=2758030 RepID=UPI0028A63315|nr:metalloregulator ArsR/SmtB family transcription factor [Pseudonocardia pini]
MTSPAPLDDMFRALAEPRRRDILRLVADTERAAGEIAAEFEVSRTAVSQHLTVLRESGLISERREGTRRLYRARREALRELQKALDGIWSGALDRAKALVEES